MPTPIRPTDLLAEVPRLRRYARVLTGDSELADRLVEETLLRFRAAAGEVDSSSVRTLKLMALLRSVAGEKTREHSAPVAAASLAPAGDAESALARLPRSAKWAQEQGANARSLSDRAAEMLAQLGVLPPEQREVLVLVAVERLSYNDIATVLRVPVATVVARLSQAREALHEASTDSHSTPHNAS